MATQQHEATDETRGAARARAAWWRWLLPLGALAALALLLAHSGERDAPADEPAPGPREVVVPLPPMPEPEPASERARGIYMLETPGIRISLELMRERRFRFLSTREGVVREGVGTWSLVGNQLTLAYTHLDGKPVGEQPMVAVNLWTESEIQLKDTGLAGPVFLRKRSVIKQVR